MERKEIVEVLKKSRIDNKWSQEYAAERYGISDRQLRDIEHCESDLRLDNLVSICDGLGLEVLVSPKCKGSN